MKKIMGSLLFILMVFVALNARELRRFPQIVSGYYAKEFCSCVFVSALPDQFCHGRTETYLPISSLEWSREQGEVRVTGLFRSSLARFEPQRGCYLVP